MTSDTALPVELDEKGLNAAAIALAGLNNKSVADDVDQRMFGESAAKVIRAYLRALSATRTETPFDDRDATNLLSVIADIRDKSGLGAKPMLSELADAIGEAVSTRTDLWEPIETAPSDVELLLGWWRTWPDLAFEQTIDFAHSTRGKWRHGQATVWQPLPAPPITTEGE